jgi:hypothetical protein
MFFRDAFGHANRHFPQSRVLIANGDIFFDETLARLDDDVLSGRLVCLSRWDVPRDGSMKLAEHPESADAWAIRTPLPDIAADFALGLPGCDGRLPFVAREAGLQPINPSLTIRVYHLHATGLRHWTWEECVPGPRLPVPPTTLKLALASTARPHATP